MERIVILDELRNRTASLHARVERSIDWESLCGSVDAYRGLLARLLGLYGPMEDELSSFDWCSIGLRFEHRRKAGLLIEDLRALGLSESRIDVVPRCSEVARPPTLAGAVGCLYVLEGATMGGQVISRQVARSLGITPATGGSFHGAYGVETGSMWRGFRDAANGYCGDDAARARDAVAGAAATFEAFERWLAAGDAGDALAGAGVGRSRE